MESKSRGRYVLFTVALELPVSEDKEAAELRGYNWLARRLTPRYASSSAAELLSFNTVPVDDKQLRQIPPSENGDRAGVIYGYLVRLHGDFQAGEPAPAWLVQTLLSAGDGAQVRFYGITDARAALLTGRPG